MKRKVEKELESTKDEYENYKKTQRDLLLKTKKEALAPRVEAQKKIDYLEKDLDAQRKENDAEKEALNAEVAMQRKVIEENDAEKEALKAEVAMQKKVIEDLKNRPTAFSLAADFIRAVPFVGAMGCLLLRQIIA